LTDKIILRGKVPTDELRKITASCFAGLTLDKDTNINYRFSLPNKLFDYIQAGIPVIASDLIEIRSIVEKYKTGLIISSHQPESIAECINKMITDEKFYEELIVNAKVAAKELCWEKEKDKLVEMLSGIRI
jgi:glycosyltransferase involved in cell wall biosynthesis